MRTSPSITTNTTTTTSVTTTTTTTTTIPKDDEDLWNLQIYINDPKIVTMFSHLTCLYLAITLAKTGKRIVIYDMDVECKLTSRIFAKEIAEFIGPTIPEEGDMEIIHQAKLKGFIDNPNLTHMDATLPRTFYDQFKLTNTNQEQAAFARHVRSLNLPLFIVPGHPMTYSLDESVHFSEKMFRIASLANRSTGAPFHLLRGTGRHYAADYVFVNLNPNFGALDRCMIMASHYLITSTKPDFIGQQAVLSGLLYLLTEWKQALDEVIQGTNGTKFPFPSHRVKDVNFGEFFALT